MTLEEAKKLKPGDVLHHKRLTNVDGTPLQVRVNGKVKTWKRNPDRIEIPLKHGLYNYGYLTNDTFYISGNSFHFTIEQVERG